MNLVCSGYAGSAPLQNFQALVKLSAENGYGFDYAACAAQDGSDLWFTDADGTVIPHEIDTWSHNGDSFVWVKIPEIADVSTKITLHYGDLSAKQTTTDSVWTGFAGVWHMNGTVVDGNAQDEPDATGHELHAVPRAIYTKSGTSTHLDQMKTTSGKVGTGRVNQTAVANYVQGLAVPNYSKYVADPSKFTISGWWSATALKTYPRFASAENKVNGSNIGNAWTISGNSSDGYTKLREVASNGTTYSKSWIIDSFQSPNWVYLTVVWDGTKLRVYSNGVQKGNDETIKAQTPISTGFTIGAAGNAATQNPGWVGKYDEVRMADGALSKDRIAADYKTMNAPTEFLTLAPDVDTALWTGEAGDGDAATPGNWTCYDAAGNPLSGKLPVEKTKILSCTLSANADWTTLGFTPLIPDGSTIDLNGRNLALPGFRGAGIVTNSADAALSTLTLSCGSAAENTATAVGGNIKLLKDGAGTFTSSKALTYTGGTQVDAGTIQAPKSTAAYDAAFTPFGTGKITINPNGTFNAQSTAAYTNGVILAGGTIKGGAGSGRSIVMLEQVTADSTIEQAVAAIVIGASDCPIDLCGNKVSVSIAKDTYFRWFGSLENTTGKLVATGVGTDAGYMEDFPERAPGVDLDLSSNVNFGHAVYVRDYRAANGNDGGGKGTGNGLYVSGTYTPVGTRYFGCILQDGAVLDLSGRTGSFNVRSEIDTNYDKIDSGLRKPRKNVQFPDGGTVTVNLAGRTDLKTIADSASNYIVKWGEYGEPATTTFKLDAETAVRFKLKKDSTGLKLARIKGLVVQIR